MTVFYLRCLVSKEICQVPLTLGKPLSPELIQLACEGTVTHHSPLILGEVGSQCITSRNIRCDRPPVGISEQYALLSQAKQ